ncbi:MAG: hypothetical protein P8K08_15285 [Fuerstiella sp.]|jgi:hypothetical protein|nr:hypothetical protein [Fuerstiella sp.]
MPRKTDSLIRVLKKTMLVFVVGLLPGGTATAQTDTDYHQPLSQNSPPGQAAAWMNYLRQYDPTWLQPLSVEVAGGGNVRIFSGAGNPVGPATTPALVAVNVGHVYRLHVGKMPGFPGVEIYPSVELLDRLHPPQGRENEYPIPITISAEDVRTALSGQLVTRVIYLEQPQIAQELDPLHREIPQSVLPSDNSLQEADRLGRPMAIIRIGGRRPSAGASLSFFGTGGGVELRQAVTERNATEPAVVRIGRTVISPTR